MAGDGRSTGHAANGHGQAGAGAFHYEWMGPPGAAAIMLLLPLVVYALHFACTSDVCLSLQPGSPDFLRLDHPLHLGLLPLLSSLFSLRASLLYLGWLALHFGLYLCVPGPVVRGGPLDERGNSLAYPLNGLACAAISCAVALALVLTGAIPVSDPQHSTPPPPQQ